MDATPLTERPEAPPRRLDQREFIALIAMLFATIAFSIDSMLPALPRIAAELTPDAPNAAQLIITSFVLGMGIGTLFAGPLSDAYGRKRVIVCGAAIYCGAALAAHVAPTLGTLLLARIVMGLGAAAPRIVSLALVRDLYRGREMARVVSFAMMIFTLVPAVAPLLGTAVIGAFGWRALFLSFCLFAAFSVTWLTIRQPETLPPARRRPIEGPALRSGLREVLTNRVILTTIVVQTLIFGMLFGTLSSTQSIFDQSFGRGEAFPLWFALIALVAGLASLLNAALVVRLGMRWLITTTLGAQIVLAAAMAGLTWAGAWPAALAFPAFVVWMVSLFAMAGLTLGNLNALALEPVGHIAGMAASITGSVSTVLAVGLAAPLGLAFDGTPLPLATGVAVLATIAFALMRTIPRVRD